MTLKSNNNLTVATLNTVNPSEVGRSQLGRNIKALSRSFLHRAAYCRRLVEVLICAGQTSKLYR
ncbi:hypothetical protein P4S65_06665 [Pseudoalteromonas sp. B131b]|uniref:hypothetical protein n=1 Tax=Pseudoalteromonas sp. B131b TaxID=630493 RepID=UPI00301D1BEB